MLEVLTQEYNDQLQLKLSWEDGLATGLAEGKAKGLAEGKEKGLAEGKATGRAEGQSNTLRAVARNMHASGYAVPEIAKCLGVTSQAVNELLADDATSS